MTCDAKKYKEDDLKEKKRVTAMNDLESYAISMKSAIEEGKIRYREVEAQKIALERCTEIIDWLSRDENSDAKIEVFEDRNQLAIFVPRAKIVWDQILRDRLTRLIYQQSVSVGEQILAH